MFSAKKISDFLKSQRTNIAPNQVQTYIHYLTSAFLIHQVKRYETPQIALLELDKSGIHVATYFTELPPIELLKQKLEVSIAEAQKRLNETKTFQK